MPHSVSKSGKSHKMIFNQTDAELQLAVTAAVKKIPFFWTILYGVDAYMELRRRDIALQKAKVKAYNDQADMKAAFGWGGQDR